MADSVFQSTHSVRSATCQCTYPQCGFHNFNPRTPCGVRLNAPFSTGACFLFQSTHSVRSATGDTTTVYPVTNISIHALRAECDRHTERHLPARLYFNPRTPCGVRLAKQACLTAVDIFQSTHSVRSATRRQEQRKKQSRFQSTHSVRSATEKAKEALRVSQISIHALRAECDR